MDTWKESDDEVEEAAGWKQTCDRILVVAATGTRWRCDGAVVVARNKERCDNVEDDVSGYTDVMSDKKGNQDNSFLNLMMMVDHGEFLKFS